MQMRSRLLFLISAYGAKSALFVVFFFSALLQAFSQPAYSDNPPNSVYDENQDSDSAEKANYGVYTRASPRSLVIAKDGRFVVEESDSFLRPVQRTEWRDGTEYGVTVWDYSQEGIFPCVRTEVFPHGTIRAVFDESGMETETDFFLPDGVLASKKRMEYESAPESSGGYNLVSLLEETFSPSGELVSSQESFYSYNEDGSVKSCRIYVDGAVSKLIQYADGNSRTETVFYEGAEIFTAEFIDGARVLPEAR